MFPLLSANGTNADQLSIDGSDVDITAVSTGNPHGVLLVDNVSNIDVEALGAQLSMHAAFPQQANIGFCQVVDRGFIRLRVFERGVGETRACGTGASAAVVAAYSQGLVDAKVKFRYPAASCEFIGLALANRLPWQAVPP